MPEGRGGSKSILVNDDYQLLNTYPFNNHPRLLLRNKRPLLGKAGKFILLFTIDYSPFTTCQLVKFPIFVKTYNMHILSVGEFKANFSEVLKKVMSGEEIGISYGRKKEIVARLVPKHSGKKSRRKIGVLEGKTKVVFTKDFAISEAEFLGA